MADAKTLRADFLHSNPFREELVTVALPGGAKEVLVRVPSVQERNRISSAAKNGDAAGLSEAMALSVILCVRSPQGGACVFEESDLATLMSLPSGGWLEELAGHVMSLAGNASEAAKK